MLLLLLLLDSFDVLAKPQSEQELNKTDSSVSKEDNVTCGNILPSFGNLKEIDGPSTDHHPKSCAGITTEGIPSEDITESLVGGKMSKSRLFYCAERADFISTAEYYQQWMNERQHDRPYLGLITPNTAAPSSIQ